MKKTNKPELTEGAFNLYKESQAAAFNLLDNIFSDDSQHVSSHHMLVLLGTLALIFEFVREIEEASGEKFHDLIASIYYSSFKLTLENPKHV